MANIKGLNILRTSLLIGLCGGVVAVGLDIDHLLRVWGLVEKGRALHPAALSIGLSVFVVSLSCLGGLLVKVVLRRARG